MKLLSDWKWLLRKTWSIRLVILSALLSGAEMVLPLFVDAMPRNVFAGLSMIAAVGAGVARIVAQPKMDRRGRMRPHPDPRDADFDSIRRAKRD